MSFQRNHNSEKNNLKSRFELLAIAVRAIKRGKIISTFFATVGIASLSFLLIAQAQYESAYQVRTTQIFPAAISSSGWKNVETLTFQNLDEYALYQEFNEINSATLQRNTLFNPDSEISSDNNNSNLVSGDDTASTTEPEDVQNEDPVTVDTEEVFDVTDATSTEVVNAERPDEPVDDNATGSSTDDVSEEVETVEPEPIVPVSTTSQTTSPPVVPTTSTGTASTTVFNRVSSLFRLAVSSITEAVTGASSTPTSTAAGQDLSDGTSTENEVTEESVSVSEETTVVDESVSSTTEEVSEVVNQEEDSVEEVVETIDSEATTTVLTSTSTEVESVVENPSSSSKNDSLLSTDNDEPVYCEGSRCAEHVITMNDFGFPLEEGVEISGAQLRLSFAAVQRATRDRVPVFSVRYKVATDAVWRDAGLILIEDEVSNSVNGGYYLFAIEGLESEEDLKQLSIQLVYQDDDRQVSGLFVESAWLELFTLEPPEFEPLTDVSALMENDGFTEGFLSGDRLELPNGKTIDFEFTDENSDESLIIKSSEKTYQGLTRAETYFSITNTADRADAFSLQTYFPDSLGEVTSLEVFNQNKPKEVTIPEYRPYVYHCEAGWEYAGDYIPETLEELSRKFSLPEADTVIEEVEVQDEEGESEVEFAVPTSSTSSTVSLPTGTTVSNTTTTVLTPATSRYQLMQQSTTSSLSASSSSEVIVPPALSTLEDATEESDEELVSAYSCRDTNVIRSCDELNGGNTACRVNQVKVAEHNMTAYVPGWEPAQMSSGEMPRPGFLRRAAEFIGFGPDKKEVPERFEVRTHSPNSYKIESGETLYFKMDISFSKFSSGEYWIEAIGSREYGLLDPFWRSEWRYRVPISIDNPTGQAQTEQQVFLELDSSLTGFWSNVQVDGDDIRFIREVDSDQSWYNSSWSNRLPITIQSSQIDADVDNLPVYVDLADLGTDFFADVNNDGSDIRITTDDGETELPYDLVSINTGAETGQLHFLASTTISSATNTTFYIYYGNEAASAYAESDTYGAQNVWSQDYIAVYHLEEDASGRGNAGLYQDSTSNGYDGDDELNSTGKTGLIGQGQEVDAQGDASEYMLLPSDIVNGEQELYFSYWMNSSEPTDQALINGGASNDYLVFVRGGGTDFNLYPGGIVTTPDISNSTWRHVVVTRDTNSNEWRVFVDGNEEGTNSTTLNTLSIPVDCLVIGLEQDGSCLSSGDTSQHINAFIDEMRFKSIIPSDAYIAATYENQASTTNFYSVGAAEDQDFGTFVELDHWVQHFDIASEEADIWVQIDDLSDAASSTIYLYYGNATADSTSDEYAPFTYSTSTDLYYVVNPSQTSPIVVYSYIDGNEVSIDGGTPVPLDSGETTSFATYASTSIISALGPITARTSDDASEPPVPISFATTTHIVTTNRNNEDFYVLPPFATADIDVFEGANGAPTTGSTVQQGTSDTYNVNLGGSDAGIVEGDEAFLLYHNNDTDSYVAYPPTLRDLYGVYSNTYNYSAINGGASVEIWCSSITSGTTTGMTQGGLESNDFCSNGTQGTGDGVRLTNQSEPIGATQQADGDGNESSRFLPEPEFATRYILPQDTEYVTVVCSPRFGSVSLEIQTSAGSTVDTDTCTPSGEYPGVVNFTPASPYPQGYQVVATNNVPFYMYYEDDGTGDETNTWGAVQAKKYRALDEFGYTFGAEEENEDALYEQYSYRWYENNDALTPSSPWDLGEDGAVSEGAAIAGQGAVNPGDELRLRMNLLANNGTGTADSVAFVLQYAEAETCSAVPESNWHEVGDVGSTTAAFAGLDTTAADGDTLPSGLLTNTTVLATYEEENPSRTIPNEVGNGEYVEFDWSITPVSGAVAVNTEYCFRMLRSTQQVLNTYTTYPQLLTAGPPETPITIDRFDNEHASSTQPTLIFSAVDQGGDELDFQVQVSTDNTFASTNLDRRSDVNLFDFENVNNGSDKSPFTNGATIRFTPQSALTNGETYWWRVRAIDPDGSNTFGSWTEAQSFTINTAVTVSEWFQTTDEQFETNSLSSATTSGSDSLEADIGGSSLVGEYGSLDVTVGATSTVNLNNTFSDPVVVTSIRYSRSVANGDQPISRVFNKTGSSFDVLASTFDFTSIGTATIDYIVMEAGEALIDDGDEGIRVFATSTLVSAISGANIPTDPGGLDITFPTSFSAPPIVLAAVTTNNDPNFIAATVYDGNDISNPPTAAQVSVYLNDSLASDGHGSSEVVDIIAIEPAAGNNDGTEFATQVTAVDISDTPVAKTYSNTYSAVPGVILVQQRTMNGAQGGYAMVDIDTLPTNTDVTVAFEEGGTSGARSHTNESFSIASFENSGGDILRAGNAVVVSTPVDFDDGDVGNAWGEVRWNDTGDITYKVQYQTGSGFQDVPDSALPGNSTGFTSSPINILSLNTQIYNEIRISANLGGVNPEIFDWTVAWGQRVDIPELGDPFDNEKLADTTPTFDFASTDPQGDSLEYEITISADPTFTGASTTVNSNASSSDFVNIDNGGDAEPFNSGDTVAYTLPASLALSDNTTYWWRVRAKDPNGGDSWSPWSNPDSFTIDSATVVSSWFQTTQAQFTEGEIDGVIASTSDSVEITNQIAEYGTVTVTDNDWMTINTNLNYEDMVVVASPEYAFNGADNGRTVQVRNKTSNSFEIRAENYTESLSGPTAVDYFVIETGDWLVEDGATGLRIVAGTAENVTNVESSAYSGGGTTVTFSPAFSSAPEGILTVSTNNNSEWVGTAVSANNNEATEITTNSMDISLGVSRDSNTSRSPEDVDYVVFETGTGENNSVLFDALRGTGVSHNDTTVNYNQTFSAAPAVTLVHNNANDGADGGFAQHDTDVANTVSAISLSIAEKGPGAGTHAGENVSVLAFESASGTLIRDDSVSGGLIGIIGSEEVLFSDGVGPKFDRALFTATTPGNSTTSVQIQYRTATGSWVLIPDTQIPGNSTGFTSGTIDLTQVNIVTYPVIRLLGTLTCDATNCPTLDDWTIEWSEGVALTGNLKESDRLINVSGATVTAAVNGSPTGQTAITDGSGNFSLGNVTAFGGDTVTVYVDGAIDSDEAVGVFVYDGLGDMTGVQLYQQHVSLAADETATNTIATLAASDYSSIGDEDVFFNVDFAGNLSLCAINGCDTASLYVGVGNSFVPSTGSSKTISTHDFINDGTVELDNNTVYVSGSWENSAQTDTETSHVVFTGSSGGWYNDAWSRRLPLTIASTSINSTLTNFPIYVQLTDLPNDFFTDVKADGSDIRITTADGMTEVPYELVSINTGANTGELHFKAPTISDVADNTFYIYYGNASANTYAVTDTYGRNNVWTDYEAVWHFNDTNFVDSTGNPRTPTNTGVTATTIGTRPAINFDGNDYLDFGDDDGLDMGLDDLSISVYVQTNDNSASYVSKSYYSAQNGRYSLLYNAGDLISLFDAGAANANTAYSGTFNNNVFRQAAVTYDRDSVNSLYTDGIVRDTVGLSSYSGYDFQENNHFFVGTYNNSAGTGNQSSLNYTGKMVELKVRHDVLSADWLNAEYENQVNPATFYSVGSSTGSVSGSPVIYEYLIGTLDFYDVSFNDAVGGTVWENYNNLTILNDLNVMRGTLNRSTTSIALAGDLTTGLNGFWSGVGTTTFDSGGSSLWIDNNAVSQNIGNVVVDGAVRTVVIDSTVEAESITIGANDTLNGGGSHDIRVNGSFTNNNVFVPATSHLVVVGDATNAVITTNGNNLHTFTASTSGGVVSFSEATVNALDNFTIATGTVTMPTTRLSVGGSFSNTGGSFAHNNSEVRFTGSGNETILQNGTPFLNSFYDVSFTGTGNWTFQDINATTTNTWTQSNGSIVLPSGRLTVGRDFTTSGPGTFDANGGEVLFEIRGDDQIVTNGSSLHDVRVEDVGGSMMWYDENWSYRIPVTVRASAVPDDLDEFPVYVDLGDFPTAFFSEINSDAGDIRVTVDDGVTEVPREVVSASTTAETGELYFLASSTLSSTTDTTFYVYYGNAAASDYAVTDTFGAENVWNSEYVLVAHMNDETTSTIVNSANGNLDGTKDASNNPAESNTGQIYEAQDFAGTEHIAFGNLGNGATAITIAAWINPSSLSGGGDKNTYGHSVFSAHSSGQYTWVTAGGTGGGGSTDEVRFCAFSNNATCNVATGSNLATGKWSFVSASAIDGGAANVRVDGSNVLSFVSDGAGVWNSDSTIGDLRPDRDIEFDGEIDEVRVSNVVRTVAWQDAEYLNQATTTDFYAVGAPQQNSARRFADTNVDVTGSIFIESGRLIAPTGELEIAGSFTNQNEFDANGGQVIFDTASSSHTVNPGISPFYDLEVDGVGGALTFAANATTTNNLALVNATDLTIDTGITMAVLNTFTNSIPNASTTWTGSTLRLSGPDHTFNAKDDVGDNYATLVVVGDTDVRFWNSTATTYDTQDTASIYSQDHAGVDGELYIFGDYVRSVGTEYWSNTVDFDGADLSGSERQAVVQIANGARVLASSSSLVITGSSTASTTVAAQSGNFTLETNAATVTAAYFEMTGTDADGFQLLASTTVTQFDNGWFIIPSVSSAVTVDASTIDTNPGAQYFNTNFESGGGNVNVTLSGSPASFWWFRDGVSDRYGEAFDNADGDPGAIRWDDSSYSISVSGTVYGDDGGAILGGPTCDGSTQNVRIVVDGGTYTDTTSCSGLDGTYSFSNVAYIGDPTIVVYLDTNGGENGSVITKTPTADITDLDIYADRVMTRHEDVASLTIADMAVYDEDDDIDLRFVASTGTPDTLVVRPDTELIVASSTTFAPGGNITLQAAGSGAAHDGSLHIDDGASFVAAGNESHSVGGSFFNDAGSSFEAASSTFSFTATTSGKGITQLDASTLQFYTLDFVGIGGGWNLSADISVSDDMTIATGTVTGTGDITMQGGTLGGDGLLSLGGGTTTIETSTTLGGVQGWTFNDLVLGDGVTVGTTTRANTATTTVSGQLVISAAHYLDTGSSVWDLAGSGDVLVENGTLLEDTSTFVYSGGTGATVLSTTYYNLHFAPVVGTPTYILDGLGVHVSNDMRIAGAAATVDQNTSDAVVLIAGDLDIASGNTLSLSNTTPLVLSGSYANNGTLTANGGTIEFNSADSYTIEAGNSAFANVSLTGSGAVTILENATATAQFIIASSSDFTQQSGTRLAIGGQLIINSATTDWTGSTLYLYGGGDYTVVDKDLSESFATLEIGPNTKIRQWNSTAGSIVVDATGSLYSQDHAGIDGDLYVYGSYQEGARDDYWSYDTDFDGADLTGGSERQVDVYFADGSSAVWTGGSLTAVGTGTASTTVQNQGSGTYSLVHSGTSDALWQYVTVRDIDADGVVFTGSSVLSRFDDIDLLVEINSASAMTVGGSAITASPARTLSRVIFNSDIGVTGAINVTATGTTLSGWRFTDHTGNLDGEANDLDPAGDPGYIIWDDSAAIISISGTVYEADGTTVSSVCDDTTTNIVLAIEGSLAQNASSSCSSADGSYTISGISFGSLDRLILFIDGEPVEGVTVTKDPISSIADGDIYESYVIVRHENTNPLTIADMAVWDSSNDADVPYTAIDGGSDTLTTPADIKLLVWNGKDFEPQGSMTLSGGGAGAAYDGSFEALSNASFIGASGESHSVGGSFEFAPTAAFAVNDADFTFTTTGAARVIAVNDAPFADTVFNGSGSWIVSDTTSEFADLTVSAGTVTLATGTTTVTASLANSGAINANGGELRFTANTGTETVSLGGSDANDIVFAGNANFTMSDLNATSTGDFTVATGTVTLPAEVLSVGGDFTVLDTVAHNSGTLALSQTAGHNELTLSGNDLSTVVKFGIGTTTMVDASAAFLGDLIISNGVLEVATNTLSIGGSLDATSGSFVAASGTILFNSSDGGETVNPGNNTFYNVSFASPSGGWTVESATTTNNFMLTSANSFTLSSGATLYVGGAFMNNVGGAATTWTNTNVVLDGANAYTISGKTVATELYETLSIQQNSDIRNWNSSAVTYNIDTSSSLYSQDHAGVDGSLNIFGDFEIATTTEYWSYATDFDGTALGGGSRSVSVALASDATTTVTTAGTLNMLGQPGATTTVAAESTGDYGFVVNGGTVNFSYYSFADMDAAGLQMSGVPVVSSLSYGDYDLSVNGGTLITLDLTALDANPSLIIERTRFALSAPTVFGTNVSLNGTSTNAWQFRNDYGDLSGEAFDFDGASNCGSIRWSDSSCLITEQTEYRWRNDDGGIGVPDSEWYDASYDARKRVRVVNEDVTGYTNAAVRVPITYDSDMQTDFDDIRFTAADGVTEVDYWVERFTTGVSAEAWVEVPSLPGESTASLFMYYGSSTADSLSSSSAVFIAVDDFEDNNISEYSGQTGLFTTGAAFTYGGSYGLELGAGNKGTRLDPGIARFDQTVSQGEIIRFMQYIDTSAGASDEICTLFGVQTPFNSSNNENYGICVEQFGVDRLSLVQDAESTDNYGSVTQLSSVNVDYNAIGSGWYEIEVDWQTDNTIDVQLFSPSGTLVATTSAIDGTYTSGGIGFTSWGQNGGWDSYTSRPRTETAPAVLIGVEQVAGGATYAALQNTPASVFLVGDIARLRVAVENSGLDITDQEFTLEYSALGTAPSCAAVSSASYDPVPSIATCGANAVCMATSSHVTNGVQTTDLLEVDENTFTPGEFVGDPSNQTSVIDVDQNFYTELEYALQITNNAVDQNYCFRVTDNGTTYDAYLNVPELSLRFDPIINTVVLNEGYPISLLPGTTTAVLATTSVTDLNGYADLSAATSTFYRSGVAGGAACTPDNNNCYVAAGPQCTFTNCVGNTCDLECQVDIFFHADPTDSGSAFDGQEWFAFVEVEDISGGLDFDTSIGQELLTLRAIDIDGAINYGALEVNSDTGSSNATTSIENSGNVEADVDIQGTDLSDGFGSTIPSNQQKFATSTFTYSACGASCALLSSTSPVSLDIDLTKPTTATPPVSDEVYWGISVPIGINSAPHQGINVFTPISP